MPGTQLSRRHFSIRARQGQRRLKQGSQRLIFACCKDFFNPKLIPIKITFFFIMGATQCIAPFSTLLMKALGFTVEETGIIFTIGPLIPIIAPLLAGIMTDKVGNFRTFLVISVALSGVFSLLHVLIPPARTNLILPEKSVNFDLTCDGEVFSISYAEPGECESETEKIKMDTINVERCGYLCNPPALQMDYNLQKKANNLTVLIYHNDTFGFSCKIDLSENQKCFAKDLRPNTTVSNAEEFALRDVVLDFPKAKRTGKLLLFTLNNYMMTPQDANVFDCKTGMLRTNLEIRKVLVSASNNGENSLTTPEYVPCKFHCDGNLPMTSICNNTSQEIVHDVSLSFWLFVASKMIGAFMLGLTYTMFEAGVMAILKEHDYDYGIQRIYGSIGGMIFAPVTGYLIDFFGNDGHYTDYYLCYYIYCIVKIICALILMKLDLRFREPTRSICGNIVEIFTNIESFLLIIIVFFSGMCYGFIENFLPWHIRDLGAENWIIGLMTTVAAISAMPFLAMSDALCKSFGHIQCISFGIICYSIRCFGYSFLKNPYWCFPFEVLEGITTGLLVAAAIIYGAKLSQQSSLGTFQGMLATSHYGFGKSAGSLLGGFLMGRLGSRIAFQIFGGGSFIIAFIYYLIFKLGIQPKQEQLERRRREISTMPIEIIPKANLGEGLANPNINGENQIGKFPVTSTPKKSTQSPNQII